MFKFVTRHAFNWSSAIQKRANWSKEFRHVLNERREDFCHELAMNKNHYYVQVDIDFKSSPDDCAVREMFMRSLLKLCDDYKFEIDTRIDAVEDYVTVVANNRP